METDDVKADTAVTDRISGEFHIYGPDEAVQSLLSVFRHKCVIALESIGDDASKVENRDKALEAYSTALSLGPPSPNGLLFKWARLMLLPGSPNDTLDAATKVCPTSRSNMDPDVVVWLSLCFQSSLFTLLFVVFLKRMVASRKQSVFFSICNASSPRTQVLTARKASGNGVSCTAWIPLEIV